jgi:coenzyme F420-dependent glucose-6-phosphate dehydrogenase
VVVLGYKAATEQFDPNELLDYVIEAESQGFDDVSASDHLHPWRNDGVSTSFVWSWLGAVGALTKQVHFGTGVTCPTLRYNPVVIAQAAATLGMMFPGRFWLGLGSGEALNETAATGLWPDGHERHARLVEATEIIRRLWNGEHLTYRARYFHTRDAHIYLKPPQPVPLVLAAYGQRTARLTGKVADGWMTTAVPGPLPNATIQAIAALNDGALAVGRDPDKLMRKVEVKVIVAASRAEAQLAASLWYGNYVPDRDKYGMSDPRDLQKFGEHFVDDTLNSRWFISDDPNAHVANADRLIQAGFTHLYFHSPGPNQRAFIEFYGKHVLPVLRQKYGMAVQRPAA